MIIRIERNNLFIRRTCVTCGMRERPDDPDTFAYEGNEELGWVCFECQELSPRALQEKLRERAAEYRRYADEIEDLARQPIQVPTPEQFDAMKAQRLKELGVHRLGEP